MALFLNLAIANPSLAAPHNRQTDIFLIRGRLFRLFIRPGILSYDEIKNPFYDHWDPKWKVCYLEVSSKKDPDPRLVVRLVKFGRLVKPSSAFQRAKLPKDFTGYAIEEVGSGTIGFIVSVEDIHWLNRNRVKVKAGFYSGGLHAGSAVFTLVRRRGVWIVSEYTNAMVS